MRLELQTNRSLWVSMVMAGLVAFIPTIPEPHPAWLMGEFGIIERTTALLYLVAACFAGYVMSGAIGLTRLHAALWTLLSVVAFGEETSWLQHELGFSTPRTL